jgi:hypothetical protein
MASSLIELLPIAHGPMGHGIMDHIGYCYCLLPIIHHGPLPIGSHWENLALAGGGGRAPVSGVVLQGGHPAMLLF